MLVARERGDVGKELRLLRREIDEELEDYPLRRNLMGNYTKEEWEQRLRQLPRVWWASYWVNKEAKERLENMIKRMRELEEEIRRRQEAGESITEDGEPGPWSNFCEGMKIMSISLPLAVLLLVALPMWL